MKTFGEFLTERENLYKMTKDQLGKNIDREYDVKIPQNKIEFIKNHLETCPIAKQNTSLIDTLSKSKDFAKVKYVVPPTKK